MIKTFISVILTLSLCLFIPLFSLQPLLFRTPRVKWLTDRQMVYFLSSTCGMCGVDCQHEGFAGIDYCFLKLSKPPLALSSV